jgi:hypothetical protein
LDRSNSSRALVSEPTGLCRDAATHAGKTVRRFRTSSVTDGGVTELMSLCVDSVM